MLLEAPGQNSLDIYSIWEYSRFVGTWQTKSAEQFEHDVKKLFKRHPEDTQRALANLKAYLENLGRCDNPLLVAKLMTCIHREASGCVAVTEQPAPKNSVPVRLYLYASAVDKTVHLICAGDKKTQKIDNDCCQRYVKKHIKKP